MTVTTGQQNCCRRKLDDFPRDAGQTMGVGSDPTGHPHR